jgi:hypothetical protein
MNKLTMTAILLSISFASTGANAGMDGKKHSGQGHKNKGHMQFSLMDSNDDGSLSKEELLSFHDQRFLLIDADANGLVTKKEIKTHRQKKRFMRMDSNKDGVISEEEMILSHNTHNKRSHRVKSSGAE